MAFSLVVGCRAPETSTPIVVSRVIDGDTFEIEGLDRSLRVWGVDAPEMPTNEGKAAKAFLTRRILGTQLYCDVKDIDRYGRGVVQCLIVETGEDIAVLLLKSGHAEEYCRYSEGYYGQCD